MDRSLKKYKLKNYIFVIFVIFLSFAFVIASVIGLYVQHRLQREQVFSQIDDYLNDYVEGIGIQDKFDSFFDEWLETMESEGKEIFYDNENVSYMADANDVYFSELSIVDDEGIVRYSSNPDMIGTDRGDIKESFSDDISLNPFDEDTDIVYFGRTFQDDSGYVLFGVTEKNYRSVLWDRLDHSTAETRIGLTGYLINCDPDANIDHATESKSELEGTVLPDRSLLPESDGEIKNTRTTLYGEKCYVGALKTPVYYVIGVYPVAEADQFMLQNNIIFVILFLLSLSAFFITFFMMLDRMVLREVQKTRESLKRITDGDLNERMDAGGSLEFEELSAGINETVDKLKELIKEEEDRVKTELLNAKNIQESAVPGVFPPFPDNTAFGLYASMNTAEAVGGDFYDFFMTDEDTLVIVMADVSGKGMPAALYMMRAKTLIKTYAQQHLPVEEVARETNLKLCENLSAEMFVTAWIGFLDLPSGVLSYVHAGHTLPVLISDEVSFVKQKINTVLGGLRKAKYVRQEITLSPGDSIFLYTDGVDEAHDVNGGMYGDDRLLKLISEKVKDISTEDRNDYCRAGCEMVLSDVQAYAAGAEQYDDITMMWVRYEGNR